MRRMSRDFITLPRRRSGMGRLRRINPQQGGDAAIGFATGSTRTAHYESACMPGCGSTRGVEGEVVSIEYRWAARRNDRLPTSRAAPAVKRKRRSVTLANAAGASASATNWIHSDCADLRSNGNVSSEPARAGGNSDRRFWEQQTATSEVLRGHLGHARRAAAGVRDAMLENATRICAGQVRHASSATTATVSASPPTQRTAAEPLTAPRDPRTVLRTERSHRGRSSDAERRIPSGARDAVVGGARNWRRRTVLLCPDAQGGRADRLPVDLSPGGAPVHRQADRASHELRRAGRHRHREHAAAQRAAPAHRRSERGAGATDRHLGGAAGYLQLARRARTGVRRYARQCRRGSARPSSACCFFAKARVSHCGARTIPAAFPSAERVERAVTPSAPIWPSATLGDALSHPSRRSTPTCTIDAYLDRCRHFAGQRLSAARHRRARGRSTLSMPCRCSRRGS